MARILVVDDEPSVRTTLMTILGRAGHEVTGAGDGDEALLVFEPQCFDLVLTDIIMPNREGVETIQEIRRKAPAVPIIAISGGGRSAGASYLDVAMALGATRTLQKPVAAQALLAAVAESLASAASRPCRDSSA